MGSLVFHYLVADFYDPVWPNIAASLVCLVAVFAKLRTLEKLRKLHHEQAMQLAQDHHDELIAKMPPTPQA